MADAPLGHYLEKQGLIQPNDIDRAILQQNSGDPRRIGEFQLQLRQAVIQSGATGAMA